MNILHFILGIAALSIALYMAGYMFIGIVFNTIYLHTPETVPTEIRAMEISTASSCARAGSIVSPYISLMVSSSIVS